LDGCNLLPTPPTPKVKNEDYVRNKEEKQKIGEKKEEGKTDLGILLTNFCINIFVRSQRP
jgi:hypothetical protein